MRIPLVLFLILFFWCSVCFAASSFVYITTIPQSAPSAFRREVRIVAANYASWEYVACVADTFDPYSAEEIAKVYTLSIYSNYSRDIQAGVAPNNGTMTFALTVIQGLPECGYAALVNTTLYNVIGDYSRESDLPKGNWQPPFYAVWSNNQVQTFLGTDTSVATRLNVTTTGTYSYSASDDGFQGITAWELYREPTSSTTYIAYSLVLYQSINVLKLKSVVHKCNPTCTRDATLGSSTTALPTITANSTHWFSCYKEVTIVDNSVVDSVAYKCTVSGLADYTYSMTQVDKDFPLETSSFRTIMNSCVVDKTTMLLLMVNDTGGYTIYALDTTAAFAITSFINGTAYATSITCADQVILVGTLDGIDYYAWDTGTGVSFPPPPVPSVPVPLDAPVVVDAPVVTPNSAVNQNDTNIGELSANDKVVLGVVIGVGVPLIAGAVVLIVFRKKVQKKPPKDEEGAVYTTINELNKLIPFNQLTFTKEIGVGSYSKVFLGTWQGKKVAIKMNNQVADAEGFMAEARLTLSMPFHPNLVETYGISMNSDRPYIVQEYCEGGSLDKIVFNKIIDRQEQRALVFGIAQGLLHLHSNKIVHRDLAVRNILLKDGVPKISDFGMSRVLKDESEQGKTNNTVGPIRWMAPESIDDMTYSPKSDVWTFGIVVSEIVLGHEPHHDKNQLDIAVKIRDVGFAPSIPDSCDPVLSELMKVCWQFNPDDRPTMHQIVDFLNDNAQV